MHHFLDLLDLTADEITSLLDEAARLKRRHLSGKRNTSLAGRVLGLIFEKPSLRTRVRFVLAAPDGYSFDEPFLQVLARHLPDAPVLQNGQPTHSVRDADVIYTDVWTSMGQEAEHDQRLTRFAGFQVDRKLLAAAPAHARVMHCLPAHRGEEVTGDVLDSDRSIVFQQAGNRMHAQKALLQWLLGNQRGNGQPKRDSRKAPRRSRSR